MLYLLHREALGGVLKARKMTSEDVEIVNALVDFESQVNDSHLNVKETLASCVSPEYKGSKGLKERIK